MQIYVCRLHICIFQVFLLFCFARAANRLFAKIPIRLWRLLLCLQQLPPVPDQLDPCSTLFQHCSNMFKFNQTLFNHNQTIKSMQFMISALESVAQICKILHWANPCGHLSALATLLCYALHFEYANGVDSITHLSEITWQKSVDLDISRRVRFQSPSLPSQCGRGWRRKHWVWLFYWCIVKQQSCTLMNNRMQHIVQLQQQLDTFRVQDLLWLAHDHFDHSQSFWIIPTELKWPSWRIEWDHHWSEVEESSETITDLRGEQAAQAWEWYAYHCWFSNPCCATLRKQKNSTDLSWTQTLGAKVVATSCHQECTDQSVLLAQKMTFAHVFSPHDLWSSWMLMVSHVQDSSWKSAAGSVATPKGCWTSSRQQEPGTGWTPGSRDWPKFRDIELKWAEHAEMAVLKWFEFWTCGIWRTVPDQTTHLRPFWAQRVFVAALVVVFWVGVRLLCVCVCPVILFLRSISDHL